MSSPLKDIATSSCSQSLGLSKISCMQPGPPQLKDQRSAKNIWIWVETGWGKLGSSELQDLPENKICVKGKQKNMQGDSKNWTYLHYIYILSVYMYTYYILENCTGMYFTPRPSRTYTQHQQNLLNHQPTNQHVWEKRKRWKKLSASDAGWMTLIPQIPVV